MPSCDSPKPAEGAPVNAAELLGRLAGEADAKVSAKAEGEEAEDVVEEEEEDEESGQEAGRVPVHYVDSLTSADSEEEEEEEAKKGSSDEASCEESADADSLEKFDNEASDEGLGDISSENESASSPQPVHGCNNNSGFFEHGKAGDVTQCFGTKEDKVLDLKKSENSTGLSKSGSLSSPSDDRVPSRIPFETPL